MCSSGQLNKLTNFSLSAVSEYCLHTSALLGHMRDFPWLFVTQEEKPLFSPYTATSWFPWVLSALLCTGGP